MFKLGVRFNPTEPATMPWANIESLLTPSRKLGLRHCGRSPRAVVKSFFKWLYNNQFIDYFAEGLNYMRLEKTLPVPIPESYLEIVETTRTPPLAPEI